MILTILHVNTERALRGGELQMLMLAKELQSRGHKNRLILQNGSEALNQANERGLDFTSMSMRGEWDLMAAKKLRNQIRTTQPQIIHAHTSHAGTLALLARGNRRQPSIVLSRRVPLPLKKNALTVYKYRSMDAVLAVSHWIRARLIEAGLPPERIFVAESGTDFSRFEHLLPRQEVRGSLGIPTNAFVIGNVGHLEPQKGQMLLIQAFGQLVRQEPDIPYYLIFVGAGPALDECRSFAQHLNLSERILFPGFRSDVENYYSAMDVFFLSTIPAMGEGWSGVIREAMICSVPVIAVRQDSVSEQLTDGETGLFVEFDGLQDWVAAIEKLRADPALRHLLAKNARKHVAQFTVQRMTDKTEECYRAILETQIAAESPR
jgi:glycosyltransferase involved in cell wall biosynthesis